MPIIIKYNQPPAKEREKKITILDAPGVDVGRAVEWKVGNIAATITERDRAEICRALCVKQIKTAKCLTVKQMMSTKTCAQIITYFKGRRGWSESWITKVHAALSKAKG